MKASIHTVISAWFSRIVVSLIAFISIRLFFHYLGPSDYAAFSLLVGFGVWCLLLDFGIGISLQNGISELYAEYKTTQSLVLTACLLYLFIFAFLVIVLYISSQYISKAIFSNSILIETHRARKLVFITGILFISQIFGNISTRIYYSQLKGYVPNWITLVSSLLGLFLSWLVMVSNVNDKLFYGIILFYVPNIISGQYLFILKLYESINSGGRFIKDVAFSVLKKSYKFWLLCLLNAFVVNCDLFIISKYLNKTDLINYVFVVKIFSFSAFFYTSVFNALWSDFTILYKKGNKEVLRKKLHIAVKFSIFFVSIYLLLALLFMNQISRIIFPGADVTIPASLILSIGLYYLILAWVHGYGTILQSLSDINYLLIITLFQAFISIISQVIFLNYFGILGIPIAISLSFILTIVWALPFRVYNKHL